MTMVVIMFLRIAIIALVIQASLPTPQGPRCVFHEDNACLFPSEEAFWDVESEFFNSVGTHMFCYAEHPFRPVSYRTRSSANDRTEHCHVFTRDDIRYTCIDLESTGFKSHNGRHITCSTLRCVIDHRSGSAKSKGLIDRQRGLR